MINLINCSIIDFNKNIENKTLVCFGAGEMLDRFFECYYEFHYENKIEFIIDNNEELSGKCVTFNSVDIPIISYRQFLNMKLSRLIAILITNLYYFKSILGQLDNEERLNGADCYINILFEAFYEAEKFKFTKATNHKIPKKIHYCWFGGKSIPTHLQKFMESWEKFCPGYEIIRWDESNYDIAKNLYMKQAYETGKWGFVPDYARLDIIYNHGGIYLDTDVEMIKPFDNLLYDDMFCGFETNHSIAFGLGFGAVKGHTLIKKIMDEYEELKFINEDGSLNLIASPRYQTESLKNYGFRINNKYQNINSIAVYPMEVLCPEHFYKGIDNFTKNTHSIHHYEASWIDDSKKDKMQSIGKQLKEMIEARYNFI